MEFNDYYTVCSEREFKSRYSYWYNEAMVRFKSGCNIVAFGKGEHSYFDLDTNGVKQTMFFEQENYTRPGEQYVVFRFETVEYPIKDYNGNARLDTPQEYMSKRFVPNIYTIDDEIDHALARSMQEGVYEESTRREGRHYIATCRKVRAYVILDVKRFVEQRNSNDESLLFEVPHRQTAIVFPPYLFTDQVEKIDKEVMVRKKLTEHLMVDGPLEIKLSKEGGAYVTMEGQWAGSNYIVLTSNYTEFRYCYKDPQTNEICLIKPLINSAGLDIIVRYERRWNVEKGVNECTRYVYPIADLLNEMDEEVRLSKQRELNVFLSPDAAKLATRESRDAEAEIRQKEAKTDEHVSKSAVNNTKVATEVSKEYRGLITGLIGAAVTVTAALVKFFWSISSKSGVSNFLLPSSIGIAVACGLVGASVASKVVTKVKEKVVKPVTSWVKRNIVEPVKGFFGKVKSLFC